MIIQSDIYKKALKNIQRSRKSGVLKFMIKFDCAPACKFK